MLKVTRYVNNELALISIPLNRTYLRETQETVFAMQSFFLKYPQVTVVYVIWAIGLKNLDLTVILSLRQRYLILAYGFE